MNLPVCEDMHLFGRSDQEPASTMSIIFFVWAANVLYPTHGLAYDPSVRSGDTVKRD